MRIIAVDWGKETHKRSAFQADLSKGTIDRFPFDGSLKHLIEHASSAPTPVLIAIDAALGFPDRSWKRLARDISYQSGSFIDCLLANSLPAHLFDPIKKPEDWEPRRPFIRPPAGSWSLNHYIEISNDGIYRQVDKRLRAQPIFVTSGIPGSVGSGQEHSADGGTGQRHDL